MKGKNKRIFWFHSTYVLWETAKIVIKEQLKQENQRKLFEKLLFMIIRPEFKTVGCFDRFVQVFIAVSVVSVVSLVSFRCFGGFGSSGGFVSVFRVLVHALQKSNFKLLLGNLRTNRERVILPSSQSKLKVVL